MALVTEENITELAVERWGTAHDPRLAEVMAALVRHLHDFAREVQLSEAEWMAAIQWLTAAGQAPRVHPGVGRRGAEHARRPAQPPLRRRRDAGDRAGPVPHRRVPVPALRWRHVGGAAGHAAVHHGHRPQRLRRARRGRRARRLAGGRARPLRVPDRRDRRGRGVAARSMRAATTAATACARSPRAATPSRWTVPSGT